MSPADALFLLAESHHRPMHVGGLAVFEPAADADAGRVGELFAAAAARDRVAPRFGKRARRSLTSLGQWGWDHGGEVDLGCHVHRAALPAPGGVDELFEWVSWQHATPLDRDRPLWELHLIEGLGDGRWAIYFKIHHALADGISAMGLLRRALSPDPREREMPAPWEPRPIRTRSAGGPGGAAPGRSAPRTDLLGLPAAALRVARTAAGEAAGMVPALTGTLERALSGRGGSLSLTAPTSAFNVPITAGRGFAARSWPLERLRLVAKHTDATINDVVMALCSGALRSYLQDLDRLPGRSLVAMVPVSLHQDHLTPGDGNKIGALTCDLATHLPDPAARIAAIRTRMGEGKTALRARSGPQVLAMSALGAAPMALGMLVGGHGLWHAPNVMISNVPGPERTLYWNGARLDALYPLSIPIDGQALNITCTSTDHQINFGFTGCRTAVPRIHTLPTHLDHEFDNLERAVGL